MKTSGSNFFLHWELRFREFLQSMWRASGSVIDVAQDVEKTTLTERLAQQANNEPLTYSDYSDPKVRRSGGV